MTYKPFMQFFVKAKAPPPLDLLFCRPTGCEGFLDDAETLAVAQYRKAVLEEHGYTAVEIWERFLPRRVE